PIGEVYRLALPASAMGVDARRARPSEAGLALLRSLEAAQAGPLLASTTAPEPELDEHDHRLLLQLLGPAKPARTQAEGRVRAKSEERGVELLGPAKPAGTQAEGRVRAKSEERGVELLGPAKPARTQAEGRVRAKSEERGVQLLGPAKPARTQAEGRVRAKSEERGAQLLAREHGFVAVARLTRPRDGSPIPAVLKRLASLAERGLVEIDAGEAERHQARTEPHV